MAVPLHFRALIEGTRTPKTLEDFIVKDCPLLAEEKPKHRKHIVRMCQDWASRKSRHTSHPDYTVLSKAYLEKVWGNDKTAKSVLRDKYFDIIDADRRAGGSPRAFQPYPAIRNALAEYKNRSKSKQQAQTQQTQQIEPLDTDSLSIEKTVDVRIQPKRPTRSSAIASRVSEKVGQKPVERKSRWNGVHVPVWIALNLETLRVCAQLDDHAKNRTLARLLIEQCAASFNRTSIAVHYQQSASGRLYSAHQQIPRDVRTAAFDGYWKYDISNCHYTILSQLGQRFGKQTPHIDNYLANKSAVRSRLARSTGSDVDAVKAALIGMVFGMHLRAKGRPEFEGTDQVWRNPALVEILAGDFDKKVGVARAKFFVEDSFVQGLKSDIWKVRDAAVESMLSASMLHKLKDFKAGKTITGSIQWKNHFGGILGLENFITRNGSGRLKTQEELKKKGPPVPPTNPELLAHCLQGIEASALKSIVDLHGADMMLLLHDGFISRVKLDTTDLEARIKAVTGFDLIVEEERICYSDVLARQAEEELVDPFGLQPPKRQANLQLEKSKEGSALAHENKRLFGDFAPVSSTCPPPLLFPPRPASAAEAPEPSSPDLPSTRIGLDRTLQESRRPKWARSSPPPIKKKK